MMRKIGKEIVGRMKMKRVEEIKGVVGRVWIFLVKIAIF